MDRRSTFRFRLPWSQPSPAPSPSRTPSNQSNTKTSPNPTTTPSSSPTTETKTRNQPSSTTSVTKSTKPSSPARPSAGTQARNEAPTNTTARTPTSPKPVAQPSAEKNAASQPSTTSTNPSAKTIPVPPQPSVEIKAPTRPSTTKSAPANAPASPKTETKNSTSVITTTPTSTIAQSPSSSSPGVAPATPSQTQASKTESQPSVPPQEQHITSQTASPSDGATKSTVSQPPPSPSHAAPPSQEMTPTSAPTLKGPQVMSTDQLALMAPRPASQTSSNLPFTQPASPSKQLQGSSEHNSKAVETQPSISEKEPTPAVVLPQSEQMELQVKKATISDSVFEEKLRSPEKVMQPSELSMVKSIQGTTEGAYQISDSSGIIGESKAVRQSESIIQETKVVKEDVQETRDKSYGAEDNIGGFVTTKEHPNTVSQLKQRYTEWQEGSNNNQMQVNPLYDGKKTRAASSQPKNKTAVTGPSQKTAVSTEPDVPLHNEIKDSISKFVHRMAVGNGKQNLEERPVSVITLAGDNRGASMQLGSDSSRKEGAIHIRRGYKLNPDESADATTDAVEKLPKDARTMEDREIEAYLNCNVQGLNNSVIFDSSIAVKSPGIHMSLPLLTSEPMNSNDKTGELEAHKAEFNVTPSQKLTYKPRIRRRCLEGLFHEPSDSDPDDPEKPRRHGCNIGCLEKSNDNEIDIL